MRDARLEYQLVSELFDARDVADCERLCLDSYRCTGFSFKTSGDAATGGSRKRNCEISDRQFKETKNNYGISSALVSDIALEEQ